MKEAPLLIFKDYQKVEVIFFGSKVTRGRSLPHAIQVTFCMTKSDAFSSHFF